MTVVAAAEGYPGAVRTGDVIEGLDDGRAVDGVTVYCAGVAAGPDGSLVTAGGRVLAVTALGAHGRRRAPARRYDAIGKIHWPGMQFRTDIAASPRTTGRLVVKVAVLMGSASDKDKMAPAADTLAPLRHRGRRPRALGAPQPARRWSSSCRPPARTATSRSSAAPAWPRTSPASSPRTPRLPVVGVPLSGGGLNGVDALYSTVQMPKGIPVATVAIDGR